MNTTAQQTRITSPGPASPLSLGSPPRTPRSSLGSPTSPRGGSTPRSSSPAQPAQSNSRVSTRLLSPPLSPSSSSGGDVFSRLTNTKGYTGLHKHRFDEEGRGLGRAGREDIVIDDGSTPSVSRSKKPIVQLPLHVSISKGPVVRGPALGTQKFGTQEKVVNPTIAVEKARVVYLYRNGDKMHDGEKVVVKASYRSMQQLYDDASFKVRLVTGPVRRIYKSDLKTPVRGLDQFEDGGRYLCCGGESPILDRVPPSLAN